MSNKTDREWPDVIGSGGKAPSGQAQPQRSGLTEEGERIAPIQGDPPCDEYDPAGKGAGVEYDGHPQCAQCGYAKILHAQPQRSEPTDSCGDPGHTCEICDGAIIKSRDPYIHGDQPRPKCGLCEAGYPIVDGNHIPTQRLGMIPVTPCSDQPRPSNSDQEWTRENVYNHTVNDIVAAHNAALAAEYAKGREHNDIAIAHPLRQQLAAERERYAKLQKYGEELSERVEHNGKEADEFYKRAEKAEQQLLTAQAAIADARTVIERGVEIMTTEQAGQWTGVRSWLEQAPYDTALREHDAELEQKFAGAWERRANKRGQRK